MKNTDSCAGCKSFYVDNSLLFSLCLSSLARDYWSSLFNLCLKAHYQQLQINSLLWLIPMQVAEPMKEQVDKKNYKPKGAVSKKPQLECNFTHKECRVQVNLECHQTVACGAFCVSMPLCVVRNLLNSSSPLGVGG